MCNKKVAPSDKPQPTLQDVYEKELVSKRHNCTDIICLLIFFIFGLIQIVMSLVVFIKGGDPQNVIRPHDSSGNICSGSTPNLFYFNLPSCLSVSALVSSCPSPTICVSSCPAQNLFYMIDSQRSVLYPTYCDQNALNSYYSNQAPTSVSSSTYFTLASKQICPLYALASAGYYSRCLPTIITSVVNGVTNALYANDSTSNTTYAITDISGISITDQTISSAAKYILNLLDIQSTAQFVMQDFVNSGYLIGMLLLIASIASFIYIVLMRWVIAPFIYGTLIAIVLALAFVIYFCITKYIALQGNSTFTFSSNVSYYFSLGITWLVIGIIAGVVLIILLLIIIILIKRLRIAIQIICEASKAITSTVLSVLFPIIPLILQLAFFLYYIAVAVYLACMGNTLYKLASVSSSNSSNTTTNVTTYTSTSTSCSPSSTANYWSNTSSYICLFYKYGVDGTDTYINAALVFLNDYQWLPQLYNLFMLFWTEAFLAGLNQMILAGCFGIWYWSQSRSHCILFISIKDTLIYHLGSIAFGSLIIAIVQIIRVIIEFVERKLKKAAGNNKVTKCIITFVSCCCKCFFWCLEKFLKFVNRNAYIMVAIYGRNFCVSAFDALKLLLANPLRTLVLNGVTSFILLLGSLLISIGVGVLGFYFFAKQFYIPPALQVYLAPELHYYWLPLMAVIIGSFFIAKTFMSVFEMAVDTVFLCALKDLSIHDGTPEKPYFMSTKMLKIMSVKNQPVTVAPVPETKSVDEKKH
jgi:solute carrier family 44 (choline transporter-like protein), member 2/4/5